MRRTPNFFVLAVVLSLSLVAPEPQADDDVVNVDAAFDFAQAKTFAI